MKGESITVNNLKIQLCRTRNGSVLVLVVIALVILGALGVGAMTAAYGVRHRVLAIKNGMVAMQAAEAGYERAVFRMSQQNSMLAALNDASFDTTETLNFAESSCTYTISFHTFVGSRPVFRIVSDGQSGVFHKTVDVFVFQAIGGWDMGMCRVPAGYTSTYPVYYVDGEILDIPIHINCYGDPGDTTRDINISGMPQFLQWVSMGESRYSSGGMDKYDSVMDLFNEGIYFDQPDSKITNLDAIKTKTDSFKSTLESQKPEYVFTPSSSPSVVNAHAAVQLEFFVEDEVGKIQITNDCTVRGYTRPRRTNRTWDFKVDPDGDGSTYEKYDIYGYHYIPANAEMTGDRYTVNVEDTEVVPSYGGVEGEPGGHIYVDGNVVIGSEDYDQMVVKGDITIVATGNIWIADSVVVDGDHDADGKPSMDNPNALGLVAHGVVKVVDAGMSEYSKGGRNSYPGPPTNVVGQAYEPIGNLDSGSPQGSYRRHLSNPMVVEAAVTVGGGGWGAENVKRGSYGGRKQESSSNSDDLILRGTISEVIRGVVGSGSDGYRKKYYFDKRLMQGILPGDIWLKGKYLPTPAGWHDY